MSLFFRKFRWSIIPGQRFRKYLLYALGEIILVVAGILIAIQVNTWNQNRQLKVKEKVYLQEICDNLRDDLLRIDQVVNFNQNKVKVIEDTFKLFATKEPFENLLGDFAANMEHLVAFQLFTPNSIAYDNMINSSSIDLIRDGNIRKLLSAYYIRSNPELDTQGRAVSVTRKFVDDIGLAGLKDSVYVRMIDQYLPVISDESIIVHRDPSNIANLFQLHGVTIGQNELLLSKKEKTEALVEEITSYLEAS